MTKIIYSTGDKFQFSDGYGISIDSATNSAILIKGKGGRTGYIIERSLIPTDAIPINYNGINYEIRFALEAVSKSLS